MIYFIQAVGGGPVKIGVTYGVARRIAQLHRERKTKLRVLAVTPGDHARERKLHRRFGHLRLEREWFDPAPELLEFIDDEGRPWTGSEERPHALAMRFISRDVVEDGEPCMSPFDEEPIEITRHRLYAFQDWAGKWHCLDGSDLVELATRTWRNDDQPRESRREGGFALPH